MELTKKDVDRLIDLVLYASTAAKILDEQGFPGKAEALESRYMEVARMLEKKGYRL